MPNKKSNARQNEQQNATAEVTPLDAAQTHKMALRRQLTQSAFFALTTLIALCAICLAWFANNTRVSGSGMMISSEGSRFELASVGSPGKYDDLLGIKSGESVIVTQTENENITTTTYYTTASGDSVSWFVSEDSNVNNNAADGAIHPLSSGSIDFAVMEKSPGLGNMRFTLQMIPYGRVDSETDASFSGIDADGKTVYYAPLEATEISSQLLQGHLLVFGSKTAEDGYNNRLVADGSTSFTDSAESGLVSYITITDSINNNKFRNYRLYWIWPGYFRDFVETEQENSLFAHNTSPAFTEMIQDMNDSIGTETTNSRARYFAKNDGSLVQQSDLNDITISDSMTTKELNAYAEFYNNGDEVIGQNVAYVQFVLTAVEE